jgi:hypothetical protein
MTQPQPAEIAGSVLPLKAAEELLGGLSGVVSARIVAAPSGEVEAIHLLVTGQHTPKQVVRNVESALYAHFAMRVDHRKISVATTVARKTPGGTEVVEEPTPAPVPPPERRRASRTLYFEDIELKGSRARGTSCRVTLRQGDDSWVGEADGMDSERGRLELAARAALAAVVKYEAGARSYALEGVKRVDAFEREFVFVGVSVRDGRDQALLTGSAELRDGGEMAAALAVLDATNRWLTQPRG